jgi:hypothetical protein
MLLIYTHQHHQASPFTISILTMEKASETLGFDPTLTRLTVLEDFCSYESGTNYGNTEKLKSRIYAGYTERTSVGNTASYSYFCLHSVVLVSVH